MIDFCRVEICQWLYLNSNWFLILSGQYLNSFIDGRYIGLADIIYTCSVLRSTIISLAVEAGGIYSLEIQVEQ